MTTEKTYKFITKLKKKILFEIIKIGVPIGNLLTVKMLGKEFV